MTAPAIDSIATYGGSLNDYSPVVDPTTDRPAAGANQAYASVAAMTAICPKCFARIVGSATAPALSVSNGHNSMWGNSVGVAPVIARTALGIVTATWPATVLDGLGVTQTLNFRYAVATLEGSNAGDISCSVNANVVTLNLWNGSGSASDFAGATYNVTVW